MSKRLLVMGALCLVACEGEPLTRLPVEGRFDPDQIGFGMVPIGLSPSREAVLRNEGRVNLTVEDVIVPFDFVVPEIEDGLIGTIVAPNADLSFNVEFAPTAEGLRRGTLSVISGDRTIELTVSGTGVFQPFATCAPTVVDFGGVSRGQVAVQSIDCTATGGDVELQGVAITDGDADFALSPPFEPTLIPAGTSTTINVAFLADGPPGARSGQLTIPNNGFDSVIELTGEVEIPPPSQNDISVTLTWDTDETDVDLHMLLPGAPLFDLEGGAVYHFVTNPDWGIPGETADDPFLDIDDKDGRGPEQINLRVGPPDQYELWVHYFAGPADRATQATVAIFLDGELVGTYEQRLECKRAWRVGTIDWDGDTGTFTPNGQTISRMEGRCIRTQN